MNYPTPGKDTMITSILQGGAGRGRLDGAASPRPVWPVFSLLLGLFALVPALSPGLAEVLQYDREALAAGELWRAVTGHWTHWNREHLVWDVAVFIVLGAVCERWSRRRFLLCLASASCLVTVSAWLALPGMRYYRGLSGLDAALYAMAALMVYREGGPRRTGAGLWAALLAAALVFKVGYEAATGRTVFVQDTVGFTPVPLAHLAGAVAGLFAASAGASRGGAERTDQGPGFPPPGAALSAPEAGGKGPIISLTSFAGPAYSRSIRKRRDLIPAQLRRPRAGREKSAPGACCYGGKEAVRSRILSSRVFRTIAVRNRGRIARYFLGKEVQTHGTGKRKVVQ